MKTIIRWYLPWIALFGLVALAALLCGCAAEGMIPPPDVSASDASAPDGEAAAVPLRGPGHWDAGAPDVLPGLDALSAPDATSAFAPDAISVPDATPALALDAGSAPDTITVKPDGSTDVVKLPDATPACPLVTAQPPPAGSSSDIRWSMTVQALSTDAFCFRTCDSLIRGLAWKSFTDREVTVNGAKLAFFSSLPGTLCSSGICVGDLSNGAVETPNLPARVDQGYIFQISAGASASATITLVSDSAACPAR